MAAMRLVASTRRVSIGLKRATAKSRRLSTECSIQERLGFASVMEGGFEL